MSDEPPTPAEMFRARFKVYSRSDLADLPPVEPLIDNTLDRRSLALLAGPSGIGKTLVAGDWAACVATGRPWRTRTAHVPTGGGRVLYALGEGVYGFHARLTAWEQCWKVFIPDRFELLGKAVDLMSPSMVGELCSHISEMSYDLVVVDTLSRSMPGADENTARDMSVAIRHLDKIKDAGDGTCVLAVHHTGKDRTTIRGSSALEGACDTVYTCDGDSSGFWLTRTKRKDGPGEDQHRLAVSPVAGTDSAVVMSADKSANGSDDRVMSAFMSAFEVTGATKKDLRDAAEMPPASFHRGINALVKAGALINKGTEKQPFYRLPEE